MAESEAPCRRVTLKNGTVGKLKTMDTHYRPGVDLGNLLKESMNKFEERSSLGE